MSIVTYPKAEAVAKKMPLFTSIDPVEKELYGISTPVIDMVAVKKYLTSLDDIRYFNNPDVFAVIVSLLESRLNRLQ